MDPNSGFIKSGCSISNESEYGSGSKVLMTENLTKIQPKKKLSFFEQNLQFTYPWASLKNAQATVEAFSPQKRTSSTRKIRFINFFLSLPSWIGIQSGSGSTTLYFCCPSFDFLLYLSLVRFPLCASAYVTSCVCI